MLVLFQILFILISDITLLTLGPASQQPVPVLEPGKGQQVSPRSQQVSWSGHSLCSDPQSPRVCSRTLSGPRNVNKALGVKGITFGLFMPCRTKAVTLGRKSLKSGVYRKRQKWETAEELSQIHSLHCLLLKTRKLIYGNSSPTFQAEIADRGGHERGEETPGGEML